MVPVPEYYGCQPQSLSEWDSQCSIIWNWYIDSREHSATQSIIWFKFLWFSFSSRSIPALQDVYSHLHSEQAGNCSTRASMISSTNWNKWFGHGSTLSYRLWKESYHFPSNHFGPYLLNNHCGSNEMLSIYIVNSSLFYLIT